jgi:DNA repair protein RecN (Recombination protein N)
MLTELRIENFAIIKSLELTFSPGLVTFTGETGAGKSIILDAIEALLGGRVDSTAIRSGAERAIIQGVFRIPERARAAIEEVLEREDLKDDETDDLSLEREVRREGRSSARVNGRSASLSILRELGQYLVDIHGQSEHLSLLNVRAHLGLLDRFANDDDLLETYQKVYRRLQSVRQELVSLREAEADAERRIDLLSYQIHEIETARLQPGEEESLRQERNRLANAENLATLARSALILLDEGSPESPAATDLLGQVVRNLASLSRVDGEKAALTSQAETLLESLSEVSRELRDYLESIEYNPRRLEEIEERLDLIQRLKRKYGGSVQSVLEFAVEAQSQLEAVRHAGERIAELEKSEAELLAELAGAALTLSERRKKAAEELGKAVEAELDDLNMAEARFSVDLRYRPDPHGLPIREGEQVEFDATGIDRVEFLVAPNPGEGLKPLVRIASGGETSRLMLALKNVLARADAIPTLIFDEIDQGIGGRVGLVIGEKLWQLSREHQVMVVTHLPQLAAFGDRHFRVTKEILEGRTLTQVEPLGGKEREVELAQMLGGGASEANLRAAGELLEAARQRIAAIRPAEG